MRGDEFVAPVATIKRLARGALTPSGALHECAAIRPQGAAKTKRAIGTFVGSAQGYRDRGQYGQMCGALVVGVCALAR